MSRIPNPYKRVLKRYRWEYLKLETEVSESIQYIQQLDALDKKLDSDIEDVLTAGSDAGTLLSSDQRNNLLAIASVLAGQRQRCRARLKENELKLRQLRRRMLAAKNRSKHAQDKYDAALLAGQRDYAEAEMLELNDTFAARVWDTSKGQSPDSAIKGAVYV